MLSLLTLSMSSAMRPGDKLHQISLLAKTLSLTRGRVDRAYLGEPHKSRWTGYLVR